MSEPKPTDVRPIKSVTKVISNGEEFEIPVKPIHGTLDVKTGVFKEYINKTDEWYANKECEEDG